jgi:hypothetical protein
MIEHDPLAGQMGQTVVTAGVNPHFFGGRYPEGRLGDMP